MKMYHCYHTCKVRDCDDCQELVDWGAVTACDECDHPGDSDVDSWALLKDGRVICSPCQSSLGCTFVNEDGYEQLTELGILKTQ